MNRRLNRGLPLLASVALAAFALSVPLRVDRAQGTIAFQDACAQTGTCKSSPPDICFVNGVGYIDREWKAAEE